MSRMEHFFTNTKAFHTVWDCGRDILESQEMQREKNFRQHFHCNCYDHSVSVAVLSVQIARVLHIPVDMRSMVRGALLHDYFLYDWRDGDPSHKLHGFSHPRRAYRNAARDFALSDISADVILKHMFPMNPRLPRYRESYIVQLADKICAAREMI